MRKLLGVVFAVISVTGMSHAAVIDGNVTNGVGSFKKIDTVGLTVGKNNQKSNNLFAFNEVQNYQIDSNLKLDGGKTIAAGTWVSSQYVFFDPIKSQKQQGFVDFDGAILGLATSKRTLKETDAMFGLGSVKYKSPKLRGLEGRDSAMIGSSDENSSDDRRLLLDWRASSPGDYIRVFTLGTVVEEEVPTPTPVPTPASGLALLTAFAAFSMLRRRKTS